MPSEEEGEVEKHVDESTSPSNPWIVVTIVLGVIVLVSLLLLLRGGITGNVVSTDEAGKNILGFLNANPTLKDQVSVVSTVQEGSFYKVIVSYQGQEIPLYATLDGKYMASSVVPLESNVSQESVAPPQKVDVDASGPMLGKASANVTIIEFSDFQCPYCRKFNADSFAQLKKEYLDTGLVKFYYRHFPLDIHPMAEPTAVAAECVHKMGKDLSFYKFHDKVYAEQLKLDGGSVQSTVTYTDSQLVLWARAIGFEIANCMKDSDGKIKAIIDKDLADGKDVGVSGTPAFIINGVLVEGAVPYDQLKKVIDDQLAIANGAGSETISSDEEATGGMPEELPSTESTEAPNTDDDYTDDSNSVALENLTLNTTVSGN